MIFMDPAGDTSPEFIELVLGYSPGTVAQTLRAMHSVLDVRDRGDDIRVYHTSFIDFFVNQARSREFFIDESMQWKSNFLVCRWTRALTEQCKNDPELLRGYKYLYPSLRKFVNHFKSCRYQVDHMSSALISELDAFYHVALSISAELVGHDMLLHILAAILLLSYDLRFPYFIRLLLQLRREALYQALQPMDTMINVNNGTILIGNKYSTFRDFLFDRERSKRYFVEEDYQKDFLAQRFLRLFQTDDSLAQAGSVSDVSDILAGRWARICTDVDNPTEGLLFELYHMDLGAVLAKSLDRGLFHLFHDFETISTWLEFRTNGATLPDLIDRFRNVQKGFHIRSTRQDVDSGRHHNVVTMIILSIIDWSTSSGSLIMRDLVDHQSKIFRASVNAELRSAKFCGCSGPVFNSNCVSTPISGTTDLYHINIPAGCAQIFKEFASCLETYKSGKFTHNEYHNLTDHLLVDRPSLLTRCLPLPELLPHFQTLLDIAKTLGRGNQPMMIWEDGFSDQLKESRGKLLSWLEDFPADCANELETIRNNLLSLLIPPPPPLSFASK
ncbi:hypothetical protein E1B28_007103 [Marasmius oreades]|uniref:Uncharacterized protein n=1 Tax=Marasmius oreades TaxID=181124 RepID=A0A9P7UUK5_9AGAR|nr:uncharacterized protein E1B28_007103 [Marasmius oreades]KAG7093421.1 hypothetical protein E1B28_007103 [Marasmius oreades]